ncbi:hypothetical protein KSS87_006312 [Heliosperma pusillum]|nr:hypothetical protein KSS87_000076 [Heliosperma pusillum]KAH9612755.1 hypothetical protein KSS87_006312 [Heliosperma pusillum]
MVYSSLPLYHLDPQANWHHQQLNDNQQIILYQAQHENNTIPSSQATPPSQSGGVDCSAPTTGSIKPNSMVDRARQAQLPLPEAGLKCPRCESTNTKFCYFNNYNLSQPRHFCKTCRRYWTRGGSLRNVPVGGASRRTAKRTKARPGCSATVSVNSGGSRSLGTPMGSTTFGGGNNNSCSTNLFLSHNLPQLPFIPSLHHFGNSSPNSIGLNLLGHGGSEMEFPNLLASFEGLGRMNGMHPFENSSLGNLINHSLQSKPSDMDPEVINRMSLAKMEDPRGVNLAKEFALVQGNDQHHFNWNTHMWTNSTDLSGYASPSANGHLLG